MRITKGGRSRVARDFLHTTINLSQLRYPLPLPYRVNRAEHYAANKFLYNSLQQEEMPRSSPYQPLSRPLEIRLLELGPASHGKSSAWTMRQVSLHDDPAYVALSYVWGDSKDTTPIECNGHEFLVTKNLKNVLDHLYASCRKIVIWVDALCINQNDLKERSQQVQMMRHIFEKAHFTFAWLGPVSENSDLAMAFLAGLGYLMGLPKWVDEPQKVELLLNSYPPELPCWVALSNLLHRPWFTRVWILQEVAVPKRISLFCGDRFLPWAILDLVVKELLRLAFPFHLLGTSSPDKHSWTAVKDLIHVRYHIQEQRYISLQGLMRLSRNHQASDPRDKVYALFGLTDEADRAGIIPDYNDSVSISDIYRSLSMTFLKYPPSTNKLFVLSFAGLENHVNSEMPSWVAPWTPVDTSCFGAFSHKTGFSAAGETVPVVVLTPDPDVLGMFGMPVDSIESYADSIPLPIEGYIGHDKAVLNQPLVWEQNWLDFARASQPYPTNEDIEDVYWQTIIFGVDSEWKRADKSFGKKLTLWRRYISSMASSSGPADEASYEGFDKFGAALRHGIFSMRLGRTSKGYLGLFPISSQKDDVVVVIFGGDVPFVLRRLPNGRLRLVGECYVHGLMTGEALTGLGVRQELLQLV